MLKANHQRLLMSRKRMNSMKQKAFTQIIKQKICKEKLENSDSQLCFIKEKLASSNHGQNERGNNQFKDKSGLFAKILSEKQYFLCLETSEIISSSGSSLKCFQKSVSNINHFMNSKLLLLVCLLGISSALRTAEANHQLQASEANTHEMGPEYREHLLDALQVHDKKYADNYQGEPICRNYAGHTGTGWCARYCNNYGYEAWSYWCWTGAQEDGGYVGCNSDYECNDKRICVGRCSWI